MNKDWIKFIEDNTIEFEAGYRGGILKVDVSSLFPNVKDAIAGASQNYLGGGLLGKIESGRNFNIADLNEEELKVYYEFTDAVKRYFHEYTRHTGEEFEDMSYEDNQEMPKSAY
jgi:hypothetical protein